MGTLCNPKEAPTPINQSLAEKQTIQVKHGSQAKQINFDFTTEMLIHIKADLLILFMDRTTNLKRNDHFLKLPVQGGKLQDHAKAYIDRHKLGNDHGIEGLPFITFNTIIPTLNFNKVSIIFCDIWRRQAQNQAEFQKQMQGYFDSLKGEQLCSIAITEFTSQLGVHLQKGVKRILFDVMQMPNKPKKVEFVCLNAESKAMFMETINSHSEDLKRSIESEGSLADSNYY